MPRRLSLLLVVLGASVLHAEPDRGRIAGRVTSGPGHPLASVAITLSGAASEAKTLSDASGEYAFEGVDPGTWSVSADSATHGSAVRTNVDVDPGRTTPVDFDLTAEPDETVTLVQETPLLDPFDFASATTFLNAELQGLPSWRTPFSFIARVPGAAAEAAAFSPLAVFGPPGASFKGAPLSATTWSFDGYDVTDRSEGGAPLFWLDFASLAEMRVETSPAAAIIGAPSHVSMIGGRPPSALLSGSAGFFFTGGQLTTGNALSRDAEAHADVGGALGGRAGARLAWSRRSVDAAASGGGEAWMFRGDASSGRNALSLVRLNQASVKGDPSSARLWGLTASRSGVRSSLQASAGLIDFVRNGRSISQNELRLDGSSLIAGSHLLSLGAGRQTSKLSGAPGASLGASFAYLSDRLAFSRWVVEAGGRVDRQETDDFGPWIAAYQPQTIRWTRFQPRAGVSFLLPRASVARASFSRYALPLTGGIGLDGPPSDVSPPAGGSLRAPVFDEWIAGVEHAVVPELTVGAWLTRRTSRQLLTRGEGGLMGIPGNSRWTGVDLFARKRISNGFLFRAHGSWGDPGGRAISVPRWSYDLSALAQLPRDYSASLVVFSREGWDGQRDVLTVDARIARDIEWERVRLAISADILNAMNQALPGPGVSIGRSIRLGAGISF